MTMPPSPCDPRRAQVRFFTDLAFKYIKEMRLLIRGGKLRKQDGWRNVAAHCLLQLAVAEALAELLDLPADEGESLCRTAAIHDWNKRLEKRPQDFTDADRDKANELFRQIAEKHTLLTPADPEFLVKALVKGEATWLEQLQFYVDDICMGNSIVAWQERIAEVERRRPDLNADGRLTQLLGGPYWQRERELCEKVENDIFAALTGRATSIMTSADVPGLIHEWIRKKIGQYASGPQSAL